MSAERDFSAVSKSYNENVFILNEARNVFETEIRRLNSLIMDDVITISSRINNDELINYKINWEAPEDRSTQKDTPWMNFTTRTEVPLSIKTPNNKKFRRNVAYLMFEVVFDWDKTNQFIFQVRFENENIVADGLDEKLCEIGKEKELFKDCRHFKANTAVILSCPLDNKLLENLSLYVASSLDLCVEMVQKVFPEELYRSAQQEDEIEIQTEVQLIPQE
jgi:hypothetical protein